MKLDYYQAQTRATRLEDSAGLNYAVLGLTGEAGELANKLKKVIRDGLDPSDYEPAMAKELGDVLWYCAAVADDLGMSLSEIAQGNLDKLAARQKKGTISGDGDNR